MKFAKVLALAAALAVTSVVAVHAAPSFAPSGSQDVVQLLDGSYYNIAGHFRCDASGNALTYPVNIWPAQTATYSYAINDTVTIQAGACAAESTVSYRFAIDGYKWCAVYLDVKYVGGSPPDTAVTWIALEPRSQMTAAQDSTSLGVWPQFGATLAASGATAGLAAVDSTAGDYFRSYGTTIVPGATTGAKIWTGEKVIAFWPARGRGDTGTPQLWGFPRQKYLELKGPAGDWLTSLYLSWRVRILYGPAAADKVRIVLHVVMGN